MALDFAKCEMRAPSRQEELLRLYDFLKAIFVVDQPFFDALSEIERPLDNYLPYTLYNGEEILGVVALIPIRLWWGRREVELFGIASVATAPEYRRQGIVKHLLSHCLGIADKQGCLSVLFTDVPGVYEGAGFRKVEQKYYAARTEQLHFEDMGFNKKIYTRLTPQQFEEAAEFYRESYPNYDGKVIREGDYQKIYELFFNPYDHSKIIFCTDELSLQGYIRIENKNNELEVTELCYEVSEPETAESLLAGAMDYARENELKKIKFRLFPNHHAWDIIKQKSEALEEEAVSDFMLRAAGDKDPGEFSALQWSGSDKF